MHLPFLKTWANLRRGLRLLRRIAAKKGADDLDDVVASAAREAADLRGRIDDAENEVSKNIRAFQKHVDKCFKRHAGNVRQLQSSIQDATGELTKAVLLQLDEAQQTIAGSQRICERQMKETREAVTDLSDQMAAMRQHSAKQQDRLRRYEQGYQWTILRNFALSVIRCIDHIESRLEAEGLSDDEKQYLRAAQNELVFALEAEGIEQFEPEVGTAVKEQRRETESTSLPVEDRNKDGQIASVDRVGYRVQLDGEVQRVVRPAVVKVYRFVERGKDE